MLTGGLFLMQVMTTPGGDTASFYAAWQPGSRTLQRVTPSFTGIIQSRVVASSAGGHETLWVVTYTQQPAYSVLFDSLA